MLQQMRGLAKYIWVLVALVFVGGFLLYETSGLMGRTPVTASTAVAVVNGHEIRYNVYIARVQTATRWLRLSRDYAVEKEFRPHPGPLPQERETTWPALGRITKW